MPHEITKEPPLTKPDPKPDANSDNSATNAPQQVSFWQAMVSVMQASFGVQSPRNYERDFKQTSIMPFIVAAVLFTVLFVLTVAFVVSLVLPN
jgi:Protein of unknown function (DUF2970)